MDDSSIVAVATPDGPTPPVLRMALIVCAGSCKGPVMHKFVVNRRSGEMGAFEQVFACTACHTERRYGLLG